MQVNPGVLLLGHFRPFNKGGALYVAISGNRLNSETTGGGHVQYKVKPKGILLPGTQIQSKADIYFDLNPAVDTAFNIISNVKGRS